MDNVDALVLIYDIRGFTAASRRLGTADLGTFATAAHRAILDGFAAVPPTFVKNLGDGHLLLWETGRVPDPNLVRGVVEGAARARTSFAAFAAGHGSGGASLPTKVGIGVALGEVSRGDDYYGVAMNLAARLQNLARPEGLAVDRTVFEIVAARDAAWKTEFQRSRVRLKGLGSTIVWVKRPFSWERLLRRAAAVAAIAAVPVAYAALADAGLGVPGGAAVRRWLDRNSLSVLRPVPSDGEIRAGADRLRRDLAALVVRQRAADGWVRSDLRRTKDEEIDVWSSSQAIAALMTAPHLDAEALRAFLPGLAYPFRPDRYVEVGGRPYGWVAHPGYAYPEIEPALWTVAALARALARPGLVPAGEREAFLGRILRAQEAALTYRPLEDGGWNIFADQKDPSLHSPYSTALALLALLETREAGLPWAGSVERREALLGATARWIAGQFEPRGSPLPGWRRTHEPLDQVSPGLTLQSYGLLLRAERAGGPEVSPAILDGMARHLASLEGVTMEQPPDAGEFSIQVVEEPASPGRPERLATRSESINFLWHPWAIDAAVRWLARAGERGAAPEDTVAVRRVLGHLVVGLGSEALASASNTWTFIASETIYGLSGIPLPRGSSAGDPSK